MTTAERTEQQISEELVKLAKTQANVEAAASAGRISEHDCAERMARAEQRATNRIAFITGNPRPRQRVRQPLDNPTAGIVA
jgi:hypothetical protein